VRPRARGGKFFEKLHYLGKLSNWRNFGKLSLIIIQKFPSLTVFQNFPSPIIFQNFFQSDKVSDWENFEKNYYSFGEIFWRKFPRGGEIFYFLEDSAPLFLPVPVLP